MKKHLWKIIALVVLLAFAGSVVYSQYVSKSVDEGVVIELHVKGNPDAKVTLTEYSDFQCPACGQFFPIGEEVMNKYGDKIRFEYKHFPLMTIHKNALAAAMASEAASQQGKFWEMHDLLFKNQNTWSNSSDAKTYFIEYAGQLGLDVTLFKRHLNSSIIKTAIMDSFNEARNLQLSGTPTLFLNGEKMTINTYDDFNSQVEAAVNAAETQN